MHTSNSAIMANAEQDRWNLLCRRERGGERERIYDLFGNRRDLSCFRITICDANEIVSGEIHCSFGEAALLFEKIVCGALPPYILHEVLADFVVERS